MWFANNQSFKSSFEILLSGLQTVHWLVRPHRSDDGRDVLMIAQQQQQHHHQEQQQQQHSSDDGRDILMIAQQQPVIEMIFFMYCAIYSED